MTRGLEGRAIFLDDADRRDLLDRLSALLPEAGMCCFGWVLMWNHLHLVVQTGDEPLSRVMRRLNTGYAVTFNLRHGRRGYLFQDRFKSRLVDGDDDLMGVIRYVHRNPLKAGVVGSWQDLATYPWCGQGALVGTRPPLPFESVSAVLTLFAPDPDEARRRVQIWMGEESPSDATGESSRERIQIEAQLLETPKDRILQGSGSADLGSVPAAIHNLCSRLGVPFEELRGRRRKPRLVEARAAVAYFAVTRLGLPGVRVAELLGLSRSAVSQALDRGSRILSDSTELRPRY